MIRAHGLLFTALLSLSVARAADQDIPSPAPQAPIAAQPVADALTALARQSGLQIIYGADVVRGRVSNGAPAGLSPEEALARVLEGTGLSFEFLNARTVTIISAHTGKPTARTRSAAGLDIRMARVNAATFVSKASASAQDSQEQQNTSNAEEKSQRAKIDEVIVTATRRNERLQDVPISIAVVTAEDIDRRGFVHSEDYLRGIPGVNQTGSYSGQTVVIRGVLTETQFQSYGAGETTGFYFGEVPTTGSAGLIAGTTDIKLVDIERVEVLRGPQGTAFGNSAMGGVVRTIPIAPKLDRFEGKLGAGYSATSGTGGENYMFQAVGNVPLVKDKLAIRGTAYAFSDSGFYRNRAGSDPAFQAAIAPFGAQAFATDEEEAGAYYTSGGRIAALFQASDALRFTLSYLTQKNEGDGTAVQNSRTYEQTIMRVAPEHVVRGETGGVFDYNVDIANAVMEYDLGWADLLATYSYLKGESTQAISYTAFNQPWPMSFGATYDHDGRIGEIRLATKLNGAWNFLVGLYAEKLHDNYLIPSIIWHGDPAANFLFGPERSWGAYLDWRDSQQKAAFGEASWQFLPGFTLTGGVRAYRYDRTVRVDTSGAAYGGGNVTLDEGEASGSNFRANLSYKPSDNGLVYASWAQGFRLGKPQPAAPSALCDKDGDGFIDGTNVAIQSTRFVDSDSVDSYELGGKFALFERRLTVDAAVFRMDWSGIPVTVRHSGSGDCFWAYLANAGAAKSDGVELQTNFHLTDAFRIDVGGSWLRARLTEDVPAIGAVAGNRLPGSPKINGNFGVEYGFKIGGHAASLRADAIYIGSFYGNVQESANTQVDGYVKLDASARVMIDHLNIDLYIRNLTNEDAFTFRASYDGGEFFGYRPRPRTIGLQLNYSF